MKEDQFLLEEYKAKWEYLRHTEEMEHKAIQWYLGIVGAILSFLYRDVSQLSAGSPDSAHVVPLSFLVVYSGFLNLHLLLQKANYKRYNDRIQDLEKVHCNFTPALPKRRLMTVFRSKYALVSLIGSVCMFLLLQAVLSRLLISAIAAALAMATAIAATFLRRFAH